MIDAGVLAVLRSSDGAISCRTPPVPSSWNPVDRPHVALLMDTHNGAFRFFLSGPSNKGQGFWVRDFDLVPESSLVEIRYNSSDFRYYRRDRNLWTKVGEARCEFFIEVYHHGGETFVVEAPSH